MNTMTTGAIRRLLTTFLILFLILSGVAAYVQIFNQAFINGPVLAHGSFDPRDLPALRHAHSRNDLRPQRRETGMDSAGSKGDLRISPRV